MAFLTRYDGSGYFDVAIPAFPSNEWVIEFEIQAPATGGVDKFYTIIGEPSLIRNRVRILDAGTNPANSEVQLRLASSTVTLPCPNHDFTTMSVFRIVSDTTAGNTTLFIDGQQVGVSNPIVSSLDREMNLLGNNNGTPTDPFDQVYLLIQQNGADAHRWEAPVDGLGVVMTDSVGSADATGTGFVGSPFASFTPAPSLISINGLTTGIVLTTNTTNNTFTYADATVTDLTVTDARGKVQSLPFVDNLDGTGTFTVPALGNIVNQVDFELPLTFTLVAAEGNATLDVDSLEAQSPYEIVTLAGILNTGSASVSYNWPEQVTVGDQYAYDPAFVTINPDNTYSINTSDPEWAFTAYVIDDEGMQSFAFTSDGTTPPSDIPVDQRTPPWKLALYLTAQEGIEGAVNDVLYEWLGTLGHTGSLNDRWIQYWESLGYEGSYNDLREQWLKMNP